jgi:hypothetical protein
MELINSMDTMMELLHLFTFQMPKNGFATNYRSKLIPSWGGL